jgi:hypothetical protein
MQLSFTKRKKEKRLSKNKHQKLNLRKVKSKKTENLQKRTRLKSSSKIE